MHQLKYPYNGNQPMIQNMVIMIDSKIDQTGTIKIGGWDSAALASG